MVFMERSDVYAQVILDGKTERVVPEVPIPESMCVTFTETHWSNTKTMVDLSDLKRDF